MGCTGAWTTKARDGREICHRKSCSDLQSTDCRDRGAEASIPARFAQISCRPFLRKWNPSASDCTTATTGRTAHPKCRCHMLFPMPCGKLERTGLLLMFYRLFSFLAAAAFLMFVRSTPRASRMKRRSPFPHVVQPRIRWRPTERSDGRAPWSGSDSRQPEATVFHSIACSLEK